MRKLIRILAYLFTIFVVVTIVMIVFSPYKKYGNNNFKSVDYTIEINAPIDSVYAYLGNSKNASEWSAFVDHITHLNPEKYKDGNTGSIRRCFKESDEQGIFWDEEIVEVIPNEKRRLTVYNLQGFSLSANGLQTEQLYVKDSRKRCVLTFSLFFRDCEPGVMDLLKMYYSSYTIRNIFKKNLENVKSILEQRKVQK